VQVGLASAPAPSTMEPCLPSSMNCNVFSSRRCSMPKL
jgi:hypothetical protein